jgi:hypothetical protein
MHVNVRDFTLFILQSFHQHFKWFDKAYYLKKKCSFCPNLFQSTVKWLSCHLSYLFQLELETNLLVQNVNELENELSKM